MKYFIKYMLMQKKKLIVCAAVLISFISCAQFRALALKFDSSIHAAFASSSLEDHMRTNACVIMGKVLVHGADEHHIAVVAFNAYLPRERPADQIILNEAGPYMLYLPKGEYFLFALEDDNRNGVYEQNEYAGYYGSPTVIKIKEGDVIDNIDIEVHENRYKGIKFDINLIPTVDFSTKLISRKLGTVVDLNNDTFGDNYASMNYLNPARFIELVGTNVFFLEEYNPAKIPLLFIHGCSGTPRDFMAFIQSIDRSRYQPWFYYYPSGIRLGMSSRILYLQVMELRRRYKFDYLAIIAHSMGGLVARSMLVHNDASTLAFVDFLFTISTPWGGNKSAKKGAGKAPFTVHSWFDIATGSPFLKGLYRKTLPPGTKLYLFCSYITDPSGKRIDDGTISLLSQLDKRGQKEARAVYGVENSHSGVLSDGKVIGQIQEMLTDKSEHTTGSSFLKTQSDQ
jgi:pimeloyl-ACP methyl ester carboxylesterase